MPQTEIPAAAFADTKPHYDILDGLRGVAALTVVCFHLFEAYATSHLDQKINHGYLAVDFFFILSGFVVGYAYDDRWKKMTVGDFFKRRLIRLRKRLRDDAKQCKIVLLRYAKALDNIIVIKCN